MNTKLNEIEINGQIYVQKEGHTPAFNAEGLPYVIIRTYSAGVHAGYLEKKEGGEVTLRNSRRIWYWEGAASLSQLAMEGTSKPEDCKFPCAVDKIQLQWIEIIDCTETARESIEGVPIPLLIFQILTFFLHTILV